MSGVGAWFLAMAMGAVLLASEVPSQPLLCLETGMHAAKISRLGVDARGRTLVTASNDKTLRVWDLAAGTLLATLRPPIGDGYEGRLFACALSPDGTLAATGGCTGWEWDRSFCIYLFDVTTRMLVRRISGLPSEVRQLVFSRDGRRLAAGLARDGMRLFRAADGRELARDEAYGDECYGADFDPLGNLATACGDGWIRWYDGFGGLERKVDTGSEAFGLRFSEDGGLVAVGFYGEAKVEVRRASDLALVASPDTAGAGGNLASVAWSRDGETLYAAGKHHREDGTFLVRAWSRRGQGPWADLPAGRGTVMDLAALPAGRLVWAAAVPAWGVLGGRSRVGTRADFLGPGAGLAMDGTGTRVGFDLARGASATFDLAARTLSSGFPPGMRGPRTSAPGVAVTGWDGTPTPRLNGDPLALKAHEYAHCLALVPGGGLLLGGEWSLYAFDARGGRRWVRPAPDAVRAVNVSADGALGVAAYGDGTIRWQRMADGQELLALYLDPDGRGWVAWTPDGAYDCSPGGEALLGWHVNHGRDEAADFYPASGFQSQFRRPDLVARALSAGRPGATDRPRTPVVRILSPESGARLQAGMVQLRCAVRESAQDPIDEVWAEVDGQRVEARGLRLQPHAWTDGERVYVLEAAMPARDCMMSVFARRGTALSQGAAVGLAWAGPAEGFAVQPKLYVLAIGVSAYQRQEFSLDYPAKDARDLAAAFGAQKGKLFRDVEVKLLTDARATKDNVMDGLEWLERQVTAKDVAVLFLAGHGINDSGGRYCFLPADADPGRIKRTMVAESELRDTLASLPGKVLLFLDTCHGGSLLNGAGQRGSSDPNGFINELASAENGVVVFSASTGRQVSQESREWNNGAFTKALVEGLSGRADLQRTGRVTVNMLDLYISERVKALTHGTQAPTTAKPGTVPDFPVAITP